MVSNRRYPLFACLGAQGTDRAIAFGVETFGAREAFRRVETSGAHRPRGALAG